MDFDINWESVENEENKDLQQLNLNSYRKVDIDSKSIMRYKPFCKSLSHIRVGNGYKGYIYLDGMEVVAFINVNIDENFIQALEISKPYRGFKLSYQLLNVAVNDLGARRLSVNKNNTVAISLYKKYGFKSYDYDKTMIYMKIKNSSLKESTHILFEAPDDSGAGDDELQATDYGDVENVDVGDSEDLGPEDYSDTPDDENTEGDNIDDTEADPNADNNLDENPESEQTDSNAKQGNEDYERNEYLIKDFIELYNRLGNMIEKVNNDQTVKNMRNPIITQAKHNMDDIYDVLYAYITDRFNKESYLTNLYQFNLIIQALNVNLEILEKGVHPEMGKKETKKRKK